MEISFAILNFAKTKKKTIKSKFQFKIPMGDRGQDGGNSMNWSPK